MIAVVGDRLIAVVGGRHDPLASGRLLLALFGPGPVVLGPAVPDLAATGRHAVHAWAGRGDRGHGAVRASGDPAPQAAGRRTDRTHRPALTTELAAEHARLAGGLDRAADVGMLNAVMEPADTRSVLAAAIAAAPAERGEHGNLPL